MSSLEQPGRFLAGWVSLTVGCAAPIALAAMAFGSYFSRVFPGVSPLFPSCVAVALVTVAHERGSSIIAFPASGQPSLGLVAS